ncbi:MAG: hypothetical protein ACLSFZ_01225 [Frisingicoccus sp.]
MKITKILLKDTGESLFFSYPEHTVLEDAQFRVGLSVNQLDESKKLYFGSDIVSSYHILLDGRADAENHESGKRTFRTGQTFSCEEQKRMELTGEGRVLICLWPAVSAALFER